jgi:hypothetical protein
MVQQLFDQTVIGSCELQSGRPRPAGGQRVPLREI